jgi:hypothetical protein
MSEDQIEKVAPQSDVKREISTIQFPYGDLDDAVGFAKSVYEVGGQSCLVEQLAGYLKVAPTGGAFRARMAYPRIYGLVEYEKNTVSLTELGMRVVDPSQEDAAKVEAFLKVPLYKAIYEKYRGYTLPPTSALEKEMASLGVSTKQTDRARQVFDRSARQAGFFWAGAERLTLPVTRSRPDTMPTPPQPSPSENEKPLYNNAVQPAAIDETLHPFIQGLLKTLPDAGMDWSSKDRVKWLRTAAGVFDLIYEGSTLEISINLGTEE